MMQTTWTPDPTYVPTTVTTDDLSWLDDVEDADTETVWLDPCAGVTRITR